MSYLEDQDTRRCLSCEALHDDPDDIYCVPCALKIEYEITYYRKASAPFGLAETTCSSCFRTHHPEACPHVS